MIKSMTAYGESSETDNGITATAEIRSYNSRHLDLALYLPKNCSRFEDDLKKLAGRTVARGRVELRLTVEDESDDAVSFKVDETRAKAYYRALTHLQKTIGLNSEITLEQLLGGRDMILPGEGKDNLESIRPVIVKAVAAAFEELDAMRLKEGKNLAEDLEKRISFLEEKMVGVKTLSKDIPVVYKERLMERIARLTGSMDGIDPVRLSQEAALLADKSDITEEIVRAHSHIKQFRGILESGEPGGRKLNFLIQEFNREFNTMGSKAGRAELSHTVVDLKSELEKIREQVQNIE